MVLSKHISCARPVYTYRHIYIYIYSIYLYPIYIRYIQYIYSIYRRRLRRVTAAPNLFACLFVFCCALPVCCKLMGLSLGIVHGEHHRRNFRFFCRWRAKRLRKLLKICCTDWWQKKIRKICLFYVCNGIRCELYLGAKMV